MYRLGTFETSLRADPKKKVTRRVSDAQSRRGVGVPKPRPPRVVGVHAKKAPTPTSLESLTDSAVDVSSSQEEVDGVVHPDSLTRLIWRLGKPKENPPSNEFEELCVVDTRLGISEGLRDDLELENLLAGLKTVEEPKSQTRKVKDLITSFETKAEKKVGCLFSPF